MHRGLKFTACSSAATCEWWDWDRGNQNENVQFREFLLIFLKYMYMEPGQRMFFNKNVLDTFLASKG